MITLNLMFDTKIHVFIKLLNDLNEKLINNPELKLSFETALKKELEILMPDEEAFSYYDKIGVTVLMHLMNSKLCDCDLIKWFLEKSGLQQQLIPYINWRDYKNGKSACHYLMESSHIQTDEKRKIMLLLLQHGADLYLMDRNSKNPIDYLYGYCANNPEYKPFILSLLKKIVDDETLSETSKIKIIGAFTPERLINEPLFFDGEKDAIIIDKIKPSCKAALLEKNKEQSPSLSPPTIGSPSNPPPKNNNRNDKKNPFPFNLQIDLDAFYDLLKEEIGNFLQKEDEYHFYCFLPNNSFDIKFNQIFNALFNKKNMALKNDKMGNNKSGSENYNFLENDKIADFIEELAFLLQDILSKKKETVLINKYFKLIYAFLKRAQTTLLKSMFEKDPSTENTITAIKNSKSLQYIYTFTCRIGDRCVGHLLIRNGNSIKDDEIAIKEMIKISLELIEMTKLRFKGMHLETIKNTVSIHLFSPKNIDCGPGMALDNFKSIGNSMNYLKNHYIELLKYYNGIGEEKKAKITYNILKDSLEKQKNDTTSQGPIQFVLKSLPKLKQVKVKPHYQEAHEKKIELIEQFFAEIFAPLPSLEEYSSDLMLRIKNLLPSAVDYFFQSAQVKVYQLPALLFTGCNNAKIINGLINKINNKDDFLAFSKAMMLSFCHFIASGEFYLLNERFYPIWLLISKKLPLINIELNSEFRFINDCLTIIKDIEEKPWGMDLIQVIEAIEQWEMDKKISQESPWKPFLNDLPFILLVRLLSLKKDLVIAEDLSLFLNTLNRILKKGFQKESPLALFYQDRILTAVNSLFSVCCAEESVQKDSKKIRQILGLVEFIKKKINNFGNLNEKITHLRTISFKLFLAEEERKKTPKKIKKETHSQPIEIKQESLLPVKNTRRPSMFPGIYDTNIQNAIENYEKMICQDRELLEEPCSTQYEEIQQQIEQEIRKTKKKPSPQNKFFRQLLEWHKNYLAFLRLRHQSQILFKKEIWAFSEEGLKIVTRPQKLLSELQTQLNTILNHLETIQMKVSFLDEHHISLQDNNTKVLLDSIDRLKEKCEQLMQNLHLQSFEDLLLLIQPSENLSEQERIQNLEYFRHSQQKNPLLPQEIKEPLIESINKQVILIADHRERLKQPEIITSKDIIEQNVLSTEQQQKLPPIPLTIPSSENPLSFKTPPLTLNSFNELKNCPILPLKDLESHYLDINEKVKKFLVSSLENATTENLKQLMLNFLLEFYLGKNTFLQVSIQYQKMFLNRHYDTAFNSLSYEELVLLEELLAYAWNCIDSSKGEADKVCSQLRSIIEDKKEPLNYFQILSFFDAIGLLTQQPQNTDLLKINLKFLAHHNIFAKWNEFKAFEQVHILRFAYRALIDSINHWNQLPNKTSEATQEFNESIQSLYFSLVPFERGCDFAKINKQCHQLAKDAFWIRYEFQESLLKKPVFSQELPSIIPSPSHQVKLPQGASNFMASILQKEYDCFVFGGAVRALLREDTVFDFDFITNMPPQQFQQCFTQEQQGVYIPSMEATYFKRFQNGMAFDVLCKNASLNKEMFEKAVFDEMGQKLDCTMNTGLSDSQGRVYFLDKRGDQDLQQGLIRLISGKIDHIIRAIGFSTRPLQLKKDPKALTLSEESRTYILKQFDRKTPLQYDHAFLHALNKLFLYGNAAPSFVALYDYNLLECLFGLNETLLQQPLLDQPSLSFKEYLLQEFKKIDEDFLNQKNHRIFGVLALLYRKATENYMRQYPQASAQSQATSIIDNTPLLSAFTGKAREHLTESFIEACQWLKKEAFEGQQNLDIKTMPTKETNREYNKPMTLLLTTTKKSSIAVKFPSNFFKNPKSMFIENNEISRPENKILARLRHPRMNQETFAQQTKLNNFSKKRSLNPEQFKEVLNLYNTIINKNIIIHTTMLKIFLKCNPFDHKRFKQALNFYKNINDKNMVTHNTMLNLFSKLEPLDNKQFQQAWNLYKNINDKDVITHNTMLNLFSKLEPLENEQFQQAWNLYKNIDDKDTFSHSTMLNLFKKLEPLDNKKFKQAWNLYNNINNKNRVTHNTMLNLFSKLEPLDNKQFQQAWNLYNNINDKNTFTHNTMLNLFSKLEPLDNKQFQQAWNLYKNINDKDIFTHNTMLNLFSKLEPLENEQFQQAWNLYKNINDKDMVTHSTMLNLFSKFEPLDNEQFQQAWDLYNNIDDKDIFSRSTMLNLFTKIEPFDNKQFQQAWNLYKNIDDKDMVTHSTMLNLFSKFEPLGNEQFQQAWDLYNNIDDKNIFTHNTILNLFSKLEPLCNEQFQEAWDLYNNINDKNRVTHNTMLKLFAKLEPLENKQFQQAWNLYKNIDDKDIFSHSTMLNLFSKLEPLDKKQFKQAWNLYNNINDKNRVTHNTMLNLFSKFEPLDNKQFQQAWDLYNNIDDKDIFSRSTMLNLFTKIEPFDNKQFQQAWNLYKNIDDKDMVTHSTMLNLFSKFEPLGNEQFQQAWDLYNNIDDKNIFTHNTILNLFSKLEPLCNEQFQEAWDLYNNIDDKNRVTHNTMLNLFTKFEPLENEQFQQAWNLYKNINDRDRVTHNTMLNLFSKIEPLENKKFQEAFDLYKDINDKNIVTHTTMLNVIAKNKAPDFCLTRQIFEKAKNEIEDDYDKIKLYGSYLNILAKNQNPKEHDNQAFSLLKDIQSHLPDIEKNCIDLHPKPSPNGDIPFSYGITYFWLKKELLELKKKDSFKTTIIHGKGDYILKQAIEEVMNIEEIKNYFSYQADNNNPGRCFIQSNSLELNQSLSQQTNNSQLEIEGLTNNTNSFFLIPQKKAPSIKEEQKTEDFKI